MAQENGMNHDIDGFEDAPHMVPGEVEAAEQLDPTSGPASGKGSRVKLLFAFAGLLFAGGWGYANQNDFKDALGIEPKRDYASHIPRDEDVSQGCCSTMQADKGACPLTAGEAGPSVAKKESCCEDGRKKAMIAALLAGTEEKSDNDAEASKKEHSEEATASQKSENSDKTEKQEDTKSEAEPATK